MIGALMTKSGGAMIISPAFTAACMAATDVIGMRRTSKFGNAMTGVIR